MNTVFTTANLDPTPHLKSDVWNKINRDLIAKIITECMYEELLSADVTDPDKNLYAIRFDDDTSYHFKVKKRVFFGYLRVIPESVIQQDENREVNLKDAYHFIERLNKHLSIKADTAAHAIREFSNTILADAHQQSQRIMTNKELLASDEVIIESQLNAHPWIIANKGRLGFSYSDYLKFSPEMSPNERLWWIAVSRETAQFNGITELPYTKLIEDELDDSDKEHFEKILSNKGLDANDYFYMPVHPWQWENEIVSLFSREIVAKRIVPLDASSDHYQPQQSIRTFSNRDNIKKRYVKLPISILNTSVYRGLPPERVKVAPALSEWLIKKVSTDDFLSKDSKLILLGEVATINYDHPIYSKMTGVPYQFREKLAVVWRDSIHSKLVDQEQCIPLAALLHIDKNGEPLIKELIDQSSLTIKDWLHSFLTVTLEPLLHCLYKFGFVFSPHGQNAMLIVKQGCPARLAIKDFVDDANICVDPIPEKDDLPDELEDILESLEGPVLIQWIQSGLFICVFKYLTEILEDKLGYSEVDFWYQVLDVIQNYQRQFPELQERFDAFDLLRPVFPKLCLNRVRMIDSGYSDNAERPSAAVASMLENPLALLIKNQRHELAS